MPVESESGLFNPTGVWAFIPGQLVVGLTRPSILGVYYTFSFEITNPEEGQDAPVNPKPETLHCKPYTLNPAP